MNTNINQLDEKGLRQGYWEDKWYDPTTKSMLSSKCMFKNGDADGVVRIYDNEILTALFFNSDGFIEGEAFDGE